MDKRLPEDTSAGDHLIACFFTNRHHIEKDKEAVQKETDAILDCLKNAKDKIIGTGEYGRLRWEQTPPPPAVGSGGKLLLIQLLANRIPSLIGSADSHQITALDDGVMKQDGANVQFMHPTFKEEFDLDLLNVIAKTLRNGKFGSSYKDGFIGTSKDTSGTSHYSVCSGDITKTQQRNMSRSCANTTVGASQESNIYTHHAMQVTHRSSLCVESFTSCFSATAISTSTTMTTVSHPARGLDVSSIRRIQGLDMAYWGFLGVGTTLDIFQNIHILYL
ncbi:hypothetical protein Tco_0472286 [Tanacetum coccineum]